MAVIKCKMCGGDLVLQPDSTVAECEYCGTVQTVPTQDNEKKLTLFNRAIRLRYNCEFDKAAGIYESIIADFPEEAEAYWGLVLCKYGIEYVDDPATGRKIPTCHRSSFESVLRDSDFEQAMENADAAARRVYREEAKAIENIRRGILDVSANEKPYDIFICYKETDDSGNRTLDSLLAQDIYDALTARNYRVFFSRITLEDKLGQAYEPYIFAALNSAKIMLAVGTCYEHYNAVWVKNEWSRFLKLMAQDKSKYLFPCYKNIDPYDIPAEFSHLQGQDMGKIGAMQDLLRGIAKILDPLKKQVQVKETVILERSSSAAPLLRRAFLFLEDGDWANADEYCEKVLDQDPENALAYVGKLMAQLHVRKQENLKDCREPFDDQNHYRKAIRFADEALEAELTGYNAHIRERNETARKTEVYNNAVKRMDSADTESALQKAAEQFDSIPGFRDSDKLAKQCRERIEAIQAEKARMEEEKARLAAQKKQEQEAQRKKNANVVKKRNKTAAILAVIAVVCAAGLLLAGKFLPKEESQNTQVAAETETISALETTVPLSPEEVAYLEAEAWEEDGQLGRAAIAFGKLGDYKDARECSLALWKTQPRKTFDVGSGCAIALKEDGTVIVAYSHTENEETRAMQKKSLEIISEWTDIVSVCADFGILTGLKSDGTLVSCAYGVTYGYTPRFISNASEWEDILFLGGRAAVKTDSTVVGFNYSTEWDETDIEDWTDIIAVSVGNAHIVGLKSNGTVVAAGHSCCGKAEFSDWTDVVSICASDHQTVGLKSDGSVLVNGFGDARQQAAEGWTDMIAVCAGSQHTVGLKSDGTLVATGYNGNGECEVSSWADIVAIDAGWQFTVGLKSDGTVMFAGKTGDWLPDEVTQWTNIQLPIISKTPITRPEDNATAYANAEKLLAAGETAKAAIAFGKLGDYADARERSFALWRQVIPQQTISADRGITVALKNDGTVLLAGINDARQKNIKEENDIVSVSTGVNHTVALKADGTVVAYGANSHDKSEVSDWSDIIQIEAGGNCTVGLKSDGTVVAVGYSENGMLDVAGWTDIVQVSTSSHTVGLKADGTVVAVGAEGYDYGQKEVSEWTDIVAVSAGNAYTAGLKMDGTVVVCGSYVVPYEGIMDVTGKAASDWADIVAISAGINFIAGLKSDGTVVVTKDEYKVGFGNPDWTDIVAISAGENHLIGLKSDGTLAITGKYKGNPKYGEYKVDNWTDIKLPNS